MLQFTVSLRAMSCSPSVRPPWSLARFWQLIVVSASIAVGAPPALAAPAGGHVVSGNVSITGSRGETDINQSSAAAIVNWRSFSIGAGERVNIRQPDAKAALLNRVLGANPSELLGSLNANGRVYLVNPNGILVGKDARINAGSFIATTAQISDADFLRGGKLKFAGGSSAGIVNLGVIKASQGNAVLVASQVTNKGQISAPNGTAALGAATEFIYSPLGDNTLQVVSTKGLGKSVTGVDNAGLMDAAQAQLAAANGNLYELAVNQSGIVRATGIEKRGGRVMLTANGGSIRLDGSVSAHNADGSGGQVFVGGGMHGANPAIANADHTTVGAHGLIDVAATGATGKGGQVVVWSNQLTNFAGRIDGRGGAGGGNGGSAEVSGKQLSFTGSVDLTAASGVAGTLLLDPESLDIVSSLPSTSSPTPSKSGSSPITDSVTSNTQTSYLTSATLESQLATSAVELDTSAIGPSTTAGTTDGSIQVDAPITWTSGNNLTFNAGTSVTVNQSINGGNNASSPTGSPTVTFGLGPMQNGDVTTSELTVAAAATVTATTITIQASTLPAGSTRTGPLGTIQIAGQLNASYLNIYYPHVSGFTAGIAGDVSIANAANRIGTMYAQTGYGDLEGNFHVVDGIPLTVEGQYYGYPGKAIDIAAKGNLTVAPITTLSIGVAASGVTGTQANTYISLAAEGGYFINNSSLGISVAPGATASGNGHYLIYSSTPLGTAPNADNYNGWTGTPLYNKTYSANPPSTITETGNRFVYELAPVLTVTANKQKRQYGDANPTLTYTITGLVPGDSAANVYSGTPTVSTTLTPSSTAGTYTGAITVSQTGLTLSDYNYGFAGVAGTMTITKAPLTITPNAATRLYGAADPALSGTITGFKNGETVANLTTAPTYSLSSTASSPVGSYNITASGAASPDYTFTYKPGTNLFTITPAPLTITANNASRYYGASNPGFTATFKGLTNGDTSADFPNLAFTTPNSTTTSNVGGSYTIQPSGATNSNYNITYVDGSLTINPAPLTITASSASISLGAPIPSPSSYSATFNGLVAGDVPGNYTVKFTNTATNSNTAGSYAIIPSGVTDPNYAITYVNGVLSIGKALVTVTANDASRLYGGANPAFSASYAGFINGDTSSVLTSPVTFTTKAVTNSPVGTYAIVPGGAAAANYNFAYVNGILTIKPADLTITANDASRLYGSANPAFSATYNGLVAGDTPADITGLAFTTTATASSSVGSYSIQPVNAADANYKIHFVNGALTVKPAPLTVTANNATRVYGAADPAFGVSYSGLVLNDTAADIGGVTVTSNASVNSPVGNSYTLTPSGGNDANYSYTYVDGALSITPASLVITPNNASRAYGDANPAFTASYKGLAAGDTAAAISGLTYSTTAGATAGVGTYSLTASGATDPNYTISYAPGRLTITQRPLTIAAPNAQITYGDTAPTFSPIITGLASFDTASVLGSISVLAANYAVMDNAGSYAITASGAADNNYNIRYQPGTLTVNPKPATITALNAARVYGDPNPLFSATHSGFIGSQFNPSLLTIGTAATPSSNVGKYAITPQAYKDPNYAVTFVDGTLTVKPRPIKIDPADVTTEYGDAIPAFRISNIDTNLLPSLDPVNTVVSLSSPATSGSYAGTYPINVKLLNSNYSLSATPGKLTIDPFPLDVRIIPVARLYGDPNPTFTYKLYFPLPPHAVMDKNFTIGTVATTNAKSPAGFYQLTNKGSLDPRRFILASVQPAIMTVLPRPVTLAVNSVAKQYPSGTKLSQVVYFGDIPFSATLDGAAPGDTAASVFPNLSFQVFDKTGGVTLVQSDYANSYIQPAASAFKNGYAAFKGTLPTYPDSVSIPPLHTDTLSIAKTRRVGIVPKGKYALANPNYVVTAVKAGALTMTDKFKLNLQKEVTYPAPAPIKVRTTYQNDFGYYLQDYPKVAVNMVKDYLEKEIKNGSLKTGKGTLFGEIFGADAKRSATLDAAKIKAWLSDIATNQSKRLLVVGAFKDYLTKLQGMDPSKYTAGQKKLVAATEAAMKAQREKLAYALSAAKSAWEKKQSGKKGVTSSMSYTLFDGSEPYSDFIKSGLSNYVTQVVSSGAIAAGAGAGAAGAGLGAAAANPLMMKTLLPFRYAKGQGAIGDYAKKTSNAKELAKNAKNLKQQAAEADQAAEEAQASTPEGEAASAETEAAISTAEEADAAAEAAEVAAESAAEEAVAAAGEASASAVGTAALPVAIVATAVVMSAMRAVQIAKNVKQQKVFNYLTDPKDETSFNQLNLNANTKNTESQVDQLVFGAAINSMLGGNT